MPIRLVANYIDWTDNLPGEVADSGHLQLVFYVLIGSRRHVTWPYGARYRAVSV
jgi:hypothetical protein